MSARPGQPRRRRALLLGCSEFADSNLPSLRSPATDVQALATVLQDPNGSNYEVTSEINIASYEAQLAIDRFLDSANTQDLHLIYFTGHGIQDARGSLFFAFTNTDVTLPSSTAVSADWIRGRVNNSRSRSTVILLDCCFSGLFLRGMRSRAGSTANVASLVGDLPEGSGIAIITASGETEFSLEDLKGDRSLGTRPSYFTEALVTGIGSGAADVDGDGRITVDELYDYVYARIKDGPSPQRPRKMCVGEGHVVVAVTPPRPAPPTPTLPGESPRSPRGSRAHQPTAASAVESARLRGLPRSRDLSGQSLVRANLSGADLRRVDLSGSDLTEADLSGADLTDAVLHGARLDRSNLSGANLTRADLREARLLGADLGNVSWTQVGSAEGAVLLGAKIDPRRAAELVRGGAIAPGQPPKLQAATAFSDALLALDPFGRLLAVAGGRTIQVLRADDGRRLHSFAGHRDEITALAWSHDGRRLASGCRDATVHVWRVLEGDHVQALGQASRESVNAIAWSPDDNQIVTVTPRSVDIWNTIDGTHSDALGPGGYKSFVVWPSSGLQVAASEPWNGNGIHITTWGDGGYNHTSLALGGGSLLTARWSPDGTKVAIAGLDHSVRIWHITGQPISTIAVSAVSLAWSPDGRRLATLSGGTPVVWDAESGVQLSLLAEGSTRIFSMSAVSWSSDGSRIAAAGRARYPQDGAVVAVWEAADGTRRGVYSDSEYSFSSALWSPESRFIATFYTERAGLEIWSASTGNRMHHIGGDDRFASLRWLPAEDGLVGLSLSGKIHDIRLRGGETSTHDIEQLDPRFSHLQRRAVAWSPNCDRLATLASDHQLSIWRVSDGIRIRKLRHYDDLLLLEWAPTGRLLAVADRSGDVRILHLGNSFFWRTLKGTSHTRFIAWSPDGRYVATDGRANDRRRPHRFDKPDDEVVLIWRAATGTLCQTLTGKMDITSLAWSPDGIWLAAANRNGTILVWPIGAAVRSRPVDVACLVIDSSTETVKSLAWAPDGKNFATVGSDATVRIWRSNGEAVATILAQPDGAAVLYLDGRYKIDGNLRGKLWWSLGITRFEPGELDQYIGTLAETGGQTPLGVDSGKWYSGTR